MKDCKATIDTSFEEDMKKIVSFAKRIEQAGSCPEEESADACPLREDTASRCKGCKDIRSVAPIGSAVEGCFSVPRVVE